MISLSLTIFWSLQSLFPSTPVVCSNIAMVDDTTNPTNWLPSRHALLTLQAYLTQVEGCQIRRQEFTIKTIINTGLSGIKLSQENRRIAGEKHILYSVKYIAE